MFCMQYGTVSDYDTFVKYLAAASPISQTVEGRLTFHYDEEPNQNSGNNIKQIHLLIFIELFVNVLYIINRGDLKNPHLR